MLAVREEWEQGTPAVTPAQVAPEEKPCQSPWAGTPHSCPHAGAPSSGRLRAPKLMRHVERSPGRHRPSLALKRICSHLCLLVSWVLASVQTGPQAEVGGGGAHGEAATSASSQDETTSARRLPHRWAQAWDASPTPARPQVAPAPPGWDLQWGVLSWPHYI